MSLSGCCSIPSRIAYVDNRAILRRLHDFAIGTITGQTHNPTLTVRTLARNVLLAVFGAGGSASAADVGLFDLVSGSRDKFPCMCMAFFGWCLCVLGSSPR